MFGGKLLKIKFMDEEVKEFINADLANVSIEEHQKLFDAPIPSSNDFIENLEWGLLYLNGDKHASPIRHSELMEHHFNLNTFDGAWLINVDRVGGAVDSLKFLSPYTDCQPTIDMFDSVNVKILNFGNKQEDQSTYLRKMRLMDAKEIRHLRNMRYVIEDRMAFVSKEEKWYTWGQYRCCLPHKMEVNKKLITVHIPVPISMNPNYYIKDKHVTEYMKDDDYKKEIDALNMVLSMKLTSYYEWFLYIKEDDKSIGLKIPVEPESTKEVFALRDLPEGHKRKKAICNFVKEHYRNIKIKPEYDEEKRQVLVRQHLRGETKFNWRGLQVNIIPAEYDLKRVKTTKKFIKI